MLSESYSNILESIGETLFRCPKKSYVNLKHLLDVFTLEFNLDSTKQDFTHDEHEIQHAQYSTNQPKIFKN